ncbi:MAG: response regulator [Verrucomicrobia bacterium]|nr:response regulator [Verrucomicrobiota bacterium]
MKALEIANILLADDDENEELLLRRAFKKAGLPHNLIAVRDGDQAIEYLSGTGAYQNREHNPFPALLLLDLKMPRTNGFAVLQWIRQQQEIRRLIVVILTSSKQDSDIDHAYDLGANSYITKPGIIDDLTEDMRRLHAYWIEINEKPHCTRHVCTDHEVLQQN